MNNQITRPSELPLDQYYSEEDEATFPSIEVTLWNLYPHDNKGLWFDEEWETKRIRDAMLQTLNYRLKRAISYLDFSVELRGRHLKHLCLICNDHKYITYKNIVDPIFHIMASKAYFEYCNYWEADLCDKNFLVGFEEKDDVLILTYDHDLIIEGDLYAQANKAGYDVKSAEQLGIAMCSCSEFFVNKETSKVFFSDLYQIVSVCDLLSRSDSIELIKIPE